MCYVVLRREGGLNFFISLHNLKITPFPRNFFKENLLWLGYRESALWVPKKNNVDFREVMRTFTLLNYIISS